jgi:hypothetical protein
MSEISGATAREKGIRDDSEDETSLGLLDPLPNL